MMKTKKIILIAIVGILLIAAGGMMFVFGMSSVDWDFQKINNRPPFEEKTRELENENQTIILSDRNVKVKIGKSADEKIHITYFEREKEYYQIDETNGISFRKIEEYAWHENLFVVDTGSPEFIVLLPEGYAGNLDLKTSNSKMEAENVTCNNLTFKTTNGAVLLTDVRAGGAITIHSSNGKVETVRVTAAGRMYAVTTNGNLTLTDVTGGTDIEFKTSNGNVYMTAVTATTSMGVWTSNGRIMADHMSALQSVTFRSSNGNVGLSHITSSVIDVKTSNGKIETAWLEAGTSIVLTSSNGAIAGSIVGQQADFSITSRTSNSSNNLPEQSSGGAKTLNVKTSNGSINIQFVAG